MRITRRGLLIGAVAGGGLLLAFELLPRHFETPLAAGEGEVAFDAWLKIGRDGVVTVAVPQLEMGQGVTTLLPQIVAMELGADWRQVAVEPAPVSGAYANLPLAARWAELWRPAALSLAPAFADAPDDLLLERWAQDNRFTATAGGTALAAYEPACRAAGASARALLAMAAGERWGVAWEECEVAGGFVSHGENRAGFGELALAAAGFDPPDPPPLRAEAPAEAGPPAFDAEAERILPFPRLDLPSKVDGSHIFAADVRLPGMVFAAIRHGPQAGAELHDFEAELAAGQMGAISLVRGRSAGAGWLAALADNWWAAEQALAKIAPRFAAPHKAQSEAIHQALDTAVRSGTPAHSETRGGGDSGYAPQLALRYDVAPALHATLETTSATARLADGTLELWLAAQAPEAARVAAARALDLSLSDVVLYPVAAGGSFDRRLEQQVAIEAALIARAAGRPVQLTWSRWQEHVAAHPRAPVAGLLGARLDAAGGIVALRARIASPPAMHEFGQRLFGNQTAAAAIDATSGEGDPLMVEGLAGPYAIPDIAVQHIPARIDLPVAPMRGGAHGHTCFMRESFIDEAAQRHQREPLSYRIAMLGQDRRMVDCLQRAARLAQWDGGAPGTGQGLACHLMGADGGPQGRIAVIASATQGTGGVRVSKIAAAVDIGRVVNRDIALQQIEGGLIFGLGLALGSATEYAGGLPTHQRLAALALPTLEDCPEIAVELVASTAEPFDPGEIGVPAIAPAVANALFSATGLRLRRLPLLSGVA